MRLLIGEVISATQPQPVIGTAPYSLTPKMTVNISAKVGEQTYNFEQLDSSLSVSDNGNGMVVCETREEMSRVVEVVVDQSRRALAQQDYHQAIVKSGDEILQTLNPRFKKEREQEQKITTLETQLNTLQGSVEEIHSMLLKTLKTKETKV